MTEETIMDLINDTKFVIDCKYKLGLIPLLESAKKEINIVTDGIDLIYFIANISLEQREKLLKQLEKINNDIKLSNNNKMIDVKIFCPYLAGNVMFDNDILSIDEFLKINQLREELANRG